MDVRVRFMIFRQHLGESPSEGAVGNVVEMRELEEPRTSRGGSVFVRRSGG